MSKKTGKCTKEFTDEQWAELVDKGYEYTMRGYCKSKIWRVLYKDYGLPLSHLNHLMTDVKKRLIEETDIYNDKAKELQIARLTNLLEDVAEQGDSQMALKIVAELNKLLSLYESKVKVEVDKYEVTL